MPVGDLSLPDFHSIPGIKIGITSAGIKKVGRQDLVVFELAPSTQVAAVFTRNAFCAAPVRIARTHLQQAMPRYLVINTGNANAGTGVQGEQDARETCRVLAELAGVAPEEVLPFSTGVIGEPLPMARLLAALPHSLAQLDEQHWAQAAQGIMTTDTQPKGASLSVEIAGQQVHLSGIAKGAGMIQPNMATMLGFIATDAKIEANLLQQLLQEASDVSFNRITIDGDTSTNDACVLMASGVGAEIHANDHQAVSLFAAALQQLMQQLAQAIVRDGEGATKFVTVMVQGALHQAEALAVALTVAHSPLVKTALYASDANWGRILAAVGRTPGLEDLDISRVNLYLDDVVLAEKGGRASSYTEAAGAKVMQQEEITIRIELGRGQAQEIVWTCDFSHEYVSINADYRS